VNFIEAINGLVKLSLREIRKKVREIKNELPHDERDIITFSKNYTIPLSNYCINNCSYCYFNHRMKTQNEIITLFDLKKIKKLMAKAHQLNCKEALIMSGEHPDQFQIVKKRLKSRGFKQFFDYLLYICKLLLSKEFLPHTNVGYLSYDKLEQIKDYNASMGLMLESSLPRLFKKGNVHEESPGKRPDKRIEFIKNAGKLRIPFTTGLLLGIGESMIDRIKDLFLIKELNDEYEHIQEIIIQNFISKPNIRYNPKTPIAIGDIIKTAGIAKIIVENSIKIQIPPNLITGYEKQFLKVGIDDFGGISPFTRDEINPYKPWPEIEHLKKVCKAEGFELKERLPIYDKFIRKKNFISSQINNVMEFYYNSIS